MKNIKKLDTNIYGDYETIEIVDKINEMIDFINSGEFLQEKKGLKCDHQTIPWGVHKRKCGKCGEIFVVG